MFAPHPSTPGVLKMAMAVNRNLKQKERRYIAYCEQYYHTNGGSFPTAEQAAVALNYAAAEIKYFLLNVQVQKALEKRGLPWQQGGYEAALSPEQVAAAITTTNFADTRPVKQKLEELGVNPQQYNAWLMDPRYKDFVNKVADRTLENVRPEALTAFAQKIREGDMKAIKLYMDVTGEGQSDSEVQNMQVMLQKITESIQRHVQDPEILAAIAKDMLGAAPVAARNVVIEPGGRSNALTRGSS